MCWKRHVNSFLYQAKKYVVAIFEFHFVRPDRYYEHKILFKYANLWPDNRPKTIHHTLRYSSRIPVSLYVSNTHTE
jgi:hypothetical protein